jgi:hypothetical protein
VRALVDRDLTTVDYFDRLLGLIKNLGRHNSDGMTDPAGLMSQCGPASAQKRHSRVPPAPLRGRGVLAVRG